MCEEKVHSDDSEQELN